MKSGIFAMPFAKIYPLYVRKAEKKGRTREEVDTVICWLTGYDKEGLQEQINRGVDFETFFAEAPEINPNAHKITGVICGVRVEEIDDPMMQKIRWLISWWTNWQRENRWRRFLGTDFLCIHDSVERV